MFNEVSGKRSRSPSPQPPIESREVAPPAPPIEESPSILSRFRKCHCDFHGERRPVSRIQPSFELRGIIRLNAQRAARARENDLKALPLEVRAEEISALRQIAEEEAAIKQVSQVNPSEASTDDQVFVFDSPVRVKLRFDLSNVGGFESPAVSKWRSACFYPRTELGRDLELECRYDDLIAVLRSNERLKPKALAAISFREFLIRKMATLPGDTAASQVTAFSKIKIATEVLIKEFYEQLKPRKS